MEQDESYSQLFQSIKKLIQCPICFLTLEKTSLCPSCNIVICENCYNV